jgi:nitroimidazol reductase NimA-like FMN-containing flavoprotein (pyridoxamine 5'-phosphate oxidase superfamily)
MIFQLSHDEARRLLAEGTYAHLGCTVDDEPYVVPVNYVLDGDFIYLHSLPGRKLDGMRHAPRVCVQTEQIEGEYHWRSVQAFGDFEEIADGEEQERAFEIIFAQFPRLTPADSVRRHGHLGEQSLVFRIRVDRISGVGEG